jgi:Acetyl-coenzyme A transporter 1
MITFKQCDQSNKIGEFNVTVSPDNVCHGAAETEECEKGGGKCVTEIDGYYTESAVCCIFGFLWLGLWGWRTINRLQSADENEWRVIKKPSNGSSGRKGDKERLL